MRYLIYVPGQSTESQSELLGRVGLSEIGQGLDAKASEGPDNGRGKLFGWLSSTQAQLIYKPEAQTWIPSAKSGDRESGAYWVGIWKDSPPTEEDLRKPDHRKGSFVRLGNGELWSIVAQGQLERFPDLKSDGSLIYYVDEAFNWFSTEIDKRLADVIRGDDGSITLLFDMTKDWMFLCRVMAINYRITPEVVSHLRLFSQSALKRLIAQLMDMTLKEE